MARAWLDPPSLGLAICLAKTSWIRTSILKNKPCFWKPHFQNSEELKLSRCLSKSVLSSASLPEA